MTPGRSALREMQSMMKAALRLGLVAALLAVGFAAIAPSSAAQDSNTRVYQRDDTHFLNPERGFYRPVSLVNPPSMGWAQDNGFTLGHAYVRLDEWVDDSLPPEFLADLDVGFEAARQANIKIVVRFSYNASFDGTDATLERVIEHIADLAPVIERNADVIAAVQAGFIGAWGEWHASDTGLDTPENKAIVHGLVMAAVPSELQVQIRKPLDLTNIYATAFDPAAHFAPTDQSRTGHHNDCFLTNVHDAGTYYPDERADEFKAYLDAVTAVTVMGGETCGVTVDQHRTDCPTALAELDRFNWDYLNSSYYGPVLERWRADQCFDEIERRLGYRFRLIEASAATSVIAGTPLRLDVEMANEGFGKLFNERPAVVVLRNQATGELARVPATAASDFRLVQPLSGQTRTIDLGGLVPADVPAGTYDVLIELPDRSASLASNPAYSIRFANTDVWEASTGFNDLGLSVEVIATANGDVSCDGVLDLRDALMMMQFVTSTRNDSGSCPLADPSTQLNASMADMNADGGVNSADALIVLHCVAGLANPDCT